MKIFCKKMPAAVFLMLALGASAVQAQPAEEAVQAFLREITAIDFAAAPEAVHSQASRAHPYLDLEALSQRALAAHWDSVPPEDRSRFLDLMGQLIEYVAYPKTKRLMSLYTVLYPGSEESAGEARVPSVIQQQEKGLDIHVLYHLREKDGHWKIDDVILDDVSITEDLKYQFDKIITESRFDGLLQKMNERLERARKESTGPPAS